MNNDMYETAKNLELVEIEAYGCCIFFSYLILHKTLILRNVVLLLEGVPLQRLPPFLGDKTKTMF